MSNENINKSIDLFYKNMNIYILHRSNELDHEKGRPAILLKYRTKVSLVWIGTHKIDKKSNLFVKITEMEFKENLNYEISFNNIKKLKKENRELKKQICVQALKLKNRNHG